MFTRIRIERCGASPDAAFAQMASEKSKTQNMSLKIKDAKAGSKVYLVGGGYMDTNYNPLYGGRYGKVQGTIENVYANYISVKWENGQNNTYTDDMLALVSELEPKPQVQSVSLKSVVEKVIEGEFIAGKLSFSAYDVTSKVRREVNEGRAVIDNKLVEDVNGKRTQRITHDEIRVLVRGYMDLVSSYDRKFNGDYIVYQSNGTSVPASSPAPVGVVIASIPRLTFKPTGATKTPATIPSGFGAKLVSYIDARGARTLKQIQSRFKLKGLPQYTVRELADAAKLNGLRIDAKSPYHASVITR